MEFEPLDLEEILDQRGTPETVAEWKELAQGLLTDQPCVFHRNHEISSLYARLYMRRPEYFKWSGMAAFASFHVRIALWPMRMSADSTGLVDLDRMPSWRVLRLEDIDTIRRVNNGIFDDIFWAHLAFDTSAEGWERVRRLLHGSPEHSGMLEGFAALREAHDRFTAGDIGLAEGLVWKGNVRLLEHEQRAVVQPYFQTLSCPFARMFSLGSSLDFEVKGLVERARFTTSFYSFMMTRGVGTWLGSRTIPNIARFEHRWPWIRRSIVPKFVAFERSADRMQDHLKKIWDAGDMYAANKSCSIPTAP